MRNGYIDRLVSCDITYDAAYNAYRDIVKNFDMVELEVYVKYMEITRYVDKV